MSSFVPKNSSSPFTVPDSDSEVERMNEDLSDPTKAIKKQIVLLECDDEEGSTTAIPHVKEEEEEVSGNEDSEGGSEDEGEDGEGKGRDESMGLDLPFDPEKTELKLLLEGATGMSRRKIQSSIFKSMLHCLFLIVVDLVYKRETTKDFEKHCRIAEEMENLMNNMKYHQSAYWYVNFFGLFPDASLPSEVIVEYATVKKRAESKEYNGPKKFENEKEEKKKAYTLGEVIFKKVGELKSEIAKEYASVWKNNIPSGHTLDSQLFNFRKKIWRKLQSEPKTENQRKKKEYEDRKKEEGEKSVRHYKKSQSPFQMYWFPKDWLCFVLLSSPAGNRALKLLTPATALKALPKPVIAKGVNSAVEEVPKVQVEPDLSHLKPLANPSTPGNPSTNEVTDYNSDSKSLKKMGRSRTPSKSPPQVHEVKHSHTVVVKREEDDVDRSEARRKVLERNLQIAQQQLQNLEKMVPPPAEKIEKLRKTIDKLYDLMYEPIDGNDIENL